MATTKHISKLGQDIYDAVLQNYGTLEEGLENLIQLNPTLDLGLDLTSAQELNVNPADIGDVNNKEFYKINQNVLNNADGNYQVIVSDYDFQGPGDYDFQNGDIYDFN